MTIPDNSSAKAALRTTMRRRLREQPPGPCTAGDALDQRIARLDAARTIATFAALAGEVDLAPLAMRHPAHTWVYPRVDGTSLHFHIITHPADDLRPGAHGIAEPVTTTPTVDLTAIDVFLCPGLAFDARGGRLGRGGGYYDRMLAGARPDALRIGVCSSIQLIGDTHAEPHDITMHEVIAID